MYHGVETVPVNLSIKNVPDELAERLRNRAKRNCRSIQEELTAILEESVSPARLSLDEAERLLSASASKRLTTLLHGYENCGDAR